MAGWMDGWIQRVKLLEIKSDYLAAKDWQTDRLKDWTEWGPAIMDKGGRLMLMTTRLKQTNKCQVNGQQRRWRHALPGLN